MGLVGCFSIEIMSNDSLWKWSKQNFSSSIGYELSFLSLENDGWIRSWEQGYCGKGSSCMLKLGLPIFYYKWMDIWFWCYLEIPWYYASLGPSPFPLNLWPKEVLSEIPHIYFMKHTPHISILDIWAWKG